MPFDPKQLRGFLSIAESGSIGMAARAINITQPALSRMIRNLEERHGVRLFERTTKGVILTQAGEALLPYARMLLFELEGAADELRAVKGLSKGVARVGAVAAVVRTILAPSIGRLHAVAPNLQVKVVEAHDDILFSALVGNEIDLVIASNSVAAAEVEIVAECDLHDTAVVICSGDNPLADAAPTARDILPGKWVLPPLHTTPRRLVEDIVARHGLPRPNVVIEAAAHTTMMACVACTDVVTCLTIPVVKNALRDGMLKKLDIPEFTFSRRFFLYKRAKGILAPAARAFADALPLKPKAKNDAGIFGVRLAGMPESTDYNALG